MSDTELKKGDEIIGANGEKYFVKKIERSDNPQTDVITLLDARENEIGNVYRYQIEGRKIVRTHIEDTPPFFQVDDIILYPSVNPQPYKVLGINSITKEYNLMNTQSRERFAFNIQSVDDNVNTMYRGTSMTKYTRSLPRGGKRRTRRNKLRKKRRKTNRKKTNRRR